MNGFRQDLDKFVNHRDMNKSYKDILESDIRETARPTLVRSLETLPAEESIPVLFKVGTNMPSKVRAT